MRIATMGTGGIGGFLAVKLGKAGHEVVTIARGAHLAAIRENGLTLDGSWGSETVRPAIATDDPAEVGPVDAVIFGVKGDGLAAAAELCKPMLGPDTVVVPFLNGVEAADRLAAILPPKSVADGISRVSTTIAEPGLIRQTGEGGVFIFAERDNRPSDRIAALQSAMSEAGITAPPTDDIKRELWTKFVMFSAVSGITAAARCRLKHIRTVPELRALFGRALEETAALGRAHGVTFAPDMMERIWQFVDTGPDEMRASTAVDLEHGRPLEIHWVSGAVVRLAAEAGLPVPTHETLYALLLPHKDGAA